MKLVFNIIGGILTAVLIGYFVNKAESAKTNGQLYFGKLILFTSLGCLAFSCLMLWVWLYEDHGGQDIPILLLMFGMGAGFIYTIVDYLFTKGSFDSIGIEFSSFWAGKRKYHWQDLEVVNFSEISRWYVFRFNDGGKIRISEYMLGQNELFDLLDEL